MQFKMYTQDNCSYCDRLKNYLKENDLEFEEENIGPKGSDSREQFKLFYDTTPQLFHCGRLIGGFDDSMVWFEQQKNAKLLVNDSCRICRKPKNKGPFEGGCHC